MLDEVRASAAKKIFFLPHSISQMSRPDRMISVEDVEETIIRGEVIEEYADDPRGRSCLMLHIPSGRPVHVVCAPKQDYLAIITAYLPHPEQWDSEFIQRKI